MLIQALVHRSLAAQGHLREAAELLDGAIEGARLAGNAQTLAWDLLNRSFVAVHQGDVETAVAAAEESVELTRDFDESLISMYARVLLAIVRAGDRRPRAGRRALLGSGGGMALPRIPGGWRGEVPRAADALPLVLRRRDDAEEAAAHARAVATTTGLGRPSAWADRAAAFVALDSGDADAAVARALASVASADEAGVPVEAAVSRTLAGRALAQAGRHDRAVAELERAVATLEAFGAVRYRLEAERELGKLGRRTHRRTRPGPDGRNRRRLAHRAGAAACPPGRRP